MKAMVRAGMLAVAVLALALWAKAQEAAHDDEREQFELLVVGPDGKPVPKIKVDMHTTPAIVPDDVVVGKLLNIKKTNNFAQIENDENGRVVLKLPSSPKQLSVFITTPGFGPYCAIWSADKTGGTIPARLTAELESAWTMGGIVMDDEGNPVAGATIRPSIEYKKPPDDYAQLLSGATAKTDGEGKWHFDSVPESITAVKAEISHGQFRPLRKELRRADFAVEPGHQGVAKIVLDRGLTLTGKITDQDGNPIPGALVRTRIVNVTRETNSDSDGFYRLSGLEPQTVRIVVTAKDKAMQIRDVRVADPPEPENFQMKQGGKIGVKVVDADGKPVPKTRIYFQQYNGQSLRNFEFDKVNQLAGDDGIWEWHEAPLEPLAADICPPGGLQLAKRDITAREEEYVFQKLPELLIKGAVIDAATKEPVMQFRVVIGVKGTVIHAMARQQVTEVRLIWDRQRSFLATDGKYEVRQNNDFGGCGIRIEAAGYLPAESREVKGEEGEVTLDFALKKGADLAATVVTPSDKPAAGAKVAWAGDGEYILLKNGDIADRSRAALTTADGQGQIHVMPQSTTFSVIITHADGFIELQSADGSLPERIQLLPWAKVEGFYRVGKNAAPNVDIEAKINEHQAGKGWPAISRDYKTTTGRNGHYEFPRMMPGEGRIARAAPLRTIEGAAEVVSTCGVSISLESGKTTHVDIGGTGRPIVGQLLPPKQIGQKVPWQFATVEMEVYVPNIPPPVQPNPPAELANDRAKLAAWMLAWLQSEDGKTYQNWLQAMEAIRKSRDNGPNFVATADRDGRFRIEDVPAGFYSLTARFDHQPLGHFKIEDYRVEVPPMEGDRSDELLDLGEICLER